MTDYKATADQWAHEEHWATESSTAACILELRARVKNLEENLGFLTEAVSSLEDSVLESKFNSKSTPNSLQIRSLLVESVAKAIGGVAEDMDWTPEARAAIRAVADWLHKNAGGTHAAWWMLEQEVER